jgi:uncharacterized protein with FMN-binding domain
MLVRERRLMKPSTCTMALVLSAALSAASAFTPSQASAWSLLAAAPARTSQPVSLAAAHHYRDGSFTGPAVDAYYGLVQVQAEVQGGRLAAVKVLQFPSDRRTSRSINARALPRLESEVISAQGTRVDGVSGATLTSDAYLRSTAAALRQAGG